MDAKYPKTGLPYWPLDGEYLEIRTDGRLFRQCRPTTIHLIQDVQMGACGMRFAVAVFRLLNLARMEVNGPFPPRL